MQNQRNRVLPSALKETLDASQTSKAERKAATFDAQPSASLAGLKRLQDPAKFGKARFHLRLYRG